MKLLFNKEVIKTLKLDTSIDKIYSISYFWKNGAINFIYEDKIDWCSIGYYKKCSYCKNIYDLAKFNAKKTNRLIIKELQSRFINYKISIGENKSYKGKEVFYKKNKLDKKFNVFFNTTIDYYPIISSNNNNEPFTHYTLMDRERNTPFYVVYTGNIESTKEKENYSFFNRRSYISKEKEDLISKIKEILNEKIKFEKKPMINDKIAQITLPSIPIKFKYLKN